MVPKFESADRFNSKEISPTPAIMNSQDPVSELTSTRHRSKNIQSINFKLYRHKAKDIIQLYEKFYSGILNSFRVIDDFAY